MAQPSTIHIVDDEADIRHAMELILESAGYRARSYSSAREFFDADHRGSNGCVVPDLSMPDESGIELLARLQQSAAAMPVIVVSGRGDIALAVHAMKKGAVDFIEKPFSAERLIQAVRVAVEKANLNEPIPQTDLPMLSRREKEVLSEALVGKANKIIGQELKISERTVESHRASIADPAFKLARDLCASRRPCALSSGLSRADGDRGRRRARRARRKTRRPRRKGGTVLDAD
ncbi:two-component system response regulator FixJ [Rhodoblastus acidophilus]|uniref:response regulator transcription factor n=1 Tax=Rhodoblastus acidophilus TaxID=1074 RepID=UPI0029CABFE1|nr:response regulator [Rhodoblastus acidophilus]MCW2286541.1 two-component system response regulator FixJ [Rhodoblastus acidophilus]MCW2335390.1 two-component system response regulator FixJ [Rhodoblastus acidophilus]